MKKWSYIFIFILFSCLEKVPEIADTLPEIILSTAYPTTNTSIEISAHLLANELKANVEYGVVWSEKPNPTIENNKIKVGDINRGVRYVSNIIDLNENTKIYIKAYLKNKTGDLKYSNEMEVLVTKPRNWRRLGDLKFDEGQFSGIAIKLNGFNLTFIRLNENNEWEQYVHYNGIWYDPSFTWQAERFSFPQFSPRQDPLFFTLNLNKDFSRPAAFLAGGYNVSPQNTNSKKYLKDFFWVYDTQNYLQPLPFGNGPIANFTLNRNEYFLEETDTDKFWSYFSLEEFLEKKPFPKLTGNYDFLGVSTVEKGYILAQNSNEKEIQLLEYDDITDNWTMLPPFPGQGRLEGTSFSFKNKIYYGLGRQTNPVKGLSDIWEYDPKTQKWKFFTNYPGAGNIKVMASDMGNYAVLFGGYQLRESGAGSEKYFNANDTWSFSY